MSQSFNILPILFLFLGLGLLGAVVAIVFVLLKGRNQGPARAKQIENYSIDLSQLELLQVPKNIWFEVYGIPMRLRVLVMAPLGKSVAFPDESQLEETLELIVPEFSSALAEHQPIYRQWPNQLSSAGFNQQFFANLKLPGNRGRTTPWCGTVGYVETESGRIGIGLIFSADKPNRYSEIVISRDHWSEILRTKVAS